MEALISALISAVVSAASILIGWIITSRTQIKVLEVKFDDMSKRVDKHNNVIERTYELERKVAVLEQHLEDELDND
jgi:uncharacterized membrane protein YciS (DUF1049 family)